VRVFWERYGDGDTTVFLLPTWSIVHSRHWKGQIPYLARHFRVLTFDGRGNGRSDRPAGAAAYTEREFAADALAVLDATGTDRAVLAGISCGALWGTVLAADHPERVERIALAEIPGSPGAAPSPPVFVPGMINDRLWHLPFNRLEKINEQLVKGREDVFFGWEFDAAAKKLPDDVISYYVGLLSDPDALRGSFGFYRALDATIAQDAQRKSRPLTMPVLAIGGEASFGGHVADAMRPVADDVQSLVIAGAGHFVAEEAPDELLSALTEFLAPYRDGAASTDDRRSYSGATSGG
jgi:pimeloyl-ACP methyl ester carboxylesterase